MVGGRLDAGRVVQDADAVTVGAVTLRRKANPRVVHAQRLEDRLAHVAWVFAPVEPADEPVGAGEPDGPLPRPTVGVAAGAGDGLAAGDVPIVTRSLAAG